MLMLFRLIARFHPTAKDARRLAPWAFPLAGS